MKIEAINNGYAINMNLDVLEEVRDKKVIDGKEYVHTERIIKHVNSIDVIKDENFKSFFTIDIDLWNDPIKFYDNSTYYNTFISRYYCNGTQSTNEYVKACFILFENKVFSDRIKNLCTLSKIHRFNELETEIKGNLIWMPIYKYGFNNYLLIQISLYDLFELPHEKIKSLEFYAEIERYFRVKFKVDLSQELNIDTALKILNKQLHETY